jgi:hypothetical protein
MAITLSSLGVQTDIPFFSTANTVSSNYSLTTGYNYMSVGPMTINSGVTVTVPNNTTWVVV